MTPYILYIVTYLAGASWGPIVTMQEHKSEQSCKDAQVAVHAMVNDMNQTNILGGVARRDIIKSECKPQ